MPLVEPGRKAPACRTSMGVARMTCLSGPDGKVGRRGDNVKVDGHAADVLRAVDEL